MPPPREVPWIREDLQQPGPKESHPLLLLLMPTLKYRFLAKFTEQVEKRKSWQVLALNKKERGDEEGTGEY